LGDFLSFPRWLSKEDFHIESTVSACARVPEAQVAIATRKQALDSTIEPVLHGARMSVEVGNRYGYLFIGVATDCPKYLSLRPVELFFGLLPHWHVAG